MTDKVNNESLIPSTDEMQLTLTLKMTTAQVVETPVTFNNSPIWDYTHLDIIFLYKILDKGNGVNSTQLQPKT